MLKAKLDAARKNKKGFSLVELIIVMAIMVALIAVLAPQFVKYVQRARDSSVADAAENVYEIVKSEYALGNINGSGTVQVASIGGTGTIGVSVSGLTTGGAAPSGYSFTAACGIDSSKTVNSKVLYTITVTAAGDGATFNMTKADTGAESFAAADLTKA